MRLFCFSLLLIFTFGCSKSKTNHSNLLDFVPKNTTLIIKTSNLKENDIICDIGCNDGTLLNSFTTNGMTKIGIDPLANKFSHYHSDGLIIDNEYPPSESSYK